MTLKDLFDKIPISQHSNISIVNDGEMVIYFDGSNIFTAYLDQQKNLIPADIATRNAFVALGG